jgi:hypothetical protein
MFLGVYIGVERIPSEGKSWLIAVISNGLSHYLVVAKDNKGSRTNKRILYSFIND